MNRQRVESGQISGSTIYQIGRDLYTNSPAETDDQLYDIYLTYGDSDVQFLLYRIGSKKSQDEYFEALSSAFLLLTAFKPVSSRIVIAASSAISSPITRLLIDRYRPLMNPAEPHFSLIRRESSWDDYFEKRRENSKLLRGSERFSPFYDDNLKNQLEGISTIKKDNYSGQESATEWAKRAEVVVGRYLGQKKASALRLHQLSQEILEKNIFVWEIIEKELTRRKVILPRWSKELQAILAQSYLLSFSHRFLFPSGIGLDWDFWPYRSRVYYTDIVTLNHILRVCGGTDRFHSLSPLQLHALLQSHYFSAFKAQLEKARTPNEVFAQAKRQENLLSNAFKEIL